MSRAYIFMRPFYLPRILLQTRGFVIAGLQYRQLTRMKNYANIPSKRLRKRMRQRFQKKLWRVFVM